MDSLIESVFVAILKPGILGLPPENTYSMHEVFSFLSTSETATLWAFSFVFSWQKKFKPPTHHAHFKQKSAYKSHALNSIKIDWKNNHQNQD